MPQSRDKVDYPKGRIMQKHQRFKQGIILSQLLKDTNPKRKEIWVAIDTFVQSVVDKKFSNIETKDYSHAEQIIFSEYSHLEEESHNIASVNG